VNIGDTDTQIVRTSTALRARPRQDGRARISRGTTRRTLVAQARPRLLLIGLFVVALLGRFNLDRIRALEEYGSIDLRVVGFAVLGAVALIWWLMQLGRGQIRAWSRSGVAALLLLAYLALSAFWAPEGARISEQLVDVALVGLMVVMTVTLGAPDPAGARRLLLWLTAASGLVYAFGGLLLGQTSAQGRVVFLGGGSVTGQVPFGVASRS